MAITKREGVGVEDAEVEEGEQIRARDLVEHMRLREAYVVDKDDTPPGRKAVNLDFNSTGLRGRPSRSTKAYSSVMPKTRTIQER